MKNAIIFLFALFVFQAKLVLCQAYQPFATSGAIWCGDRGYLSSSPFGGFEYHTYTYQQFLLADTLINNIFYHKLYESGTFHWFTVPIGPGGSSGTSAYYNNYVGCYRESNKQIFFVQANAFGETLLYDFNFAVGDTLPATYSNSSLPLKITSIDSVFAGIAYHKKFNISTADTTSWPFDFEYVSIIEGIGSTRGLTWTLEPYFENHGSLFSYKWNGQVLYPDTAADCEITGIATHIPPATPFVVYPNPAMNMLNIILPSHNSLGAAITIYDVSGKQAFAGNINGDNKSIDISSLKNGVYAILINSFVQHFVKQ